MARGQNRRERIAEAFDALCDAMGRALGAAEGARDAAVQAHAEAMVEMWLRTDGLDAARADPRLRGLLANPRLAGPVEHLHADRAAAFGTWLATGPERLAGILAGAAPGPAGDAPREWIGTVGAVAGAGPVPSLWSIGTGRIGTAEPAFPVAVPLLDDSHLQITSTHDGRLHAEAMVENLLLRVMSYFRPGLVALHVWDVEQFTGALPGLYPLTRTGLLTVHDPGRLPHLLEELSDRIRRVHTRVLVDGRPSLRALADATGDRSEPWIIAVLVGSRSALRDEDHRQLQRVARGGLACGVQLVLLDVPMTVNAPVETVRVDDNGLASMSMTGPHVTVEPEPPLPSGAVTSACHAISDEHERRRGRIGAFADLLPAPAQIGRQRSVAGLHAPVGFADGRPVEIALADGSPHALIGGPSGSGKTNLLLTMISSMATRYDPDELEFYLLDFKEGVSFAQFAPGRRDRTWLPHARLVGVNINTDREFGLALLQFLADEMRSRAEAAKAHEVTKLEELRAADPAGRWPRIVAVIDEFQYLFAERDAVTKAATLLLEDVARRGRSQGIHLVLASQDVSGIEAFWGRPAIFEQFVLRIALPRARRVLAELNDATLGLPRWHAVLNHESGIKHGNEVIRIPDATGKGAASAAESGSTRAAAGPPVSLRKDVPELTSSVDAEEPLAGSSVHAEEPLAGSSVHTEEPLAGSSVHAEEPLAGSSVHTEEPLAGSSVHTVQRDLYERYHAGREEPRLFDGSRAPRFADLVAELPPSIDGVPRALVGQSIDVAGSAAAVRMPSAPGRNLGVLASVGREAMRVLGSAAGSLAGQFPPGAVDVVIAALVAESTGPAARLAEQCSAAGHGVETVALDGVRGRLDALATDVTERLGRVDAGSADAARGGSRRPVVLVLYAADAADTVLEREGTEALRRLLRFGPETGVHVLGWWRSVQRLRTLLTMSASVDDLGAWVALDVQGSELGSLAPGMLVNWSPRAGRGLFFDRAQHAMPEVVIVPSLEEG